MGGAIDNLFWAGQDGQTHFVCQIFGPKIRLCEMRHQRSRCQTVSLIPISSVSIVLLVNCPHAPRKLTRSWYLAYAAPVVHLTHRVRVMHHQWVVRTCERCTETKFPRISNLHSAPIIWYSRNWMGTGQCWKLYGAGQPFISGPGQGRAGRASLMDYLILIELQQPESPKVLERGADGGGAVQQVLGQLWDKQVSWRQCEYEWRYSNAFVVIM